MIDGSQVLSTFGILFGRRHRGERLSPLQTRQSFANRLRPGCEEARDRNAPLTHRIRRSRLGRSNFVKIEHAIKSRPAVILVCNPIPSTHRQLFLAQQMMRQMPRYHFEIITIYHFCAIDPRSFKHAYDGLHTVGVAQDCVEYCCIPRQTTYAYACCRIADVLRLRHYIYKMPRIFP